MKVCVVSSGSKGNMTYVEGLNTKLIIDAGISLGNAHSRVDIDFNKITDILITHAHGDHTGFIGSIVHKTNANLYMSRLTFEELNYDQKDRLLGVKIGFLQPEYKYHIGDFEVITFKLNHDCKEVFGYIVSYDNKKVGYFTDTGIFPDRYLPFLSDLDVLIIEANHNVEMLMNSKRRYDLINRILSPQGHISNNKCYKILNDVLTDKNKYVILAHVSEDCNTEQFLYEEIINRLYNFKGEILIASQHKATKVIEL